MAKAKKTETAKTTPVKQEVAQPETIKPVTKEKVKVHVDVAQRPSQPSRLTTVHIQAGTTVRLKNLNTGVTRTINKVDGTNLANNNPNRYKIVG